MFDLVDNNTTNSYKLVLITVLFLDTKSTHILHTIIYIMAKFKVGMSIRTYVDFLDHGI